MKIISDDRCTEYCHPGHPEKPERVANTVAFLHDQQELSIEWAAPHRADVPRVLRAHTEHHLARLDHPVDFDSDTSWFPHIADHARRSAGAALLALECARAGEPVMSVMRPPGHHATASRAMGFCYLNNAAITVLEALATGARRVAVFDFDVHHGNGTEDILLNHEGAALFSVQQHPCYPGTGLEHRGANAFNYPVAPLTPRLAYRRVLQQALDDLMRFRPEIIVVSAGFDAYAHDPVAQETLEHEDFHWLGERLRSLGPTCVSLLEGGYSEDLPELIFAYLKGLNGL